jgi:phosphatidylglycerophosphate synthase
MPKSETTPNMTEHPKFTTLTYKKGHWVKDDATDSLQLPSRKFSDIWWFYGNQIDYLAAAFVLSNESPFVAAGLIFLSTLLDWVDGPIARKYGQCTIFGSGIDWLADVLCQVLTLIWWAQLDHRILPFILAFTAVEIALSIFDFAITATGRYPSYEGKISKVLNSRFFTILDWSMPSGSYSHFGTFLWLAYPCFCLASCLKLAEPSHSHWLASAQLALLVPALLYIWCELAYLIFILKRWREPEAEQPIA